MLWSNRLQLTEKQTIAFSLGKIAAQSGRLGTTTLTHGTKQNRFWSEPQRMRSQAFVVNSKLQTVNSVIFSDYAIRHNGLRLCGFTATADGYIS